LLGAWKTMHSRFHVKNGELGGLKSKRGRPRKKTGKKKEKMGPEMWGIPEIRWTVSFRFQIQAKKKCRENHPGDKRFLDNKEMNGKTP